jgi:citrate synthase
MKISRPRQIYTGNTVNDYIPIEKRIASNGTV